MVNWWLVLFQACTHPLYTYHISTIGYFGANHWQNIISYVTISACVSKIGGFFQNNYKIIIIPKKLMETFNIIYPIPVQVFPIVLYIFSLSIWIRIQIRSKYYNWLMCDLLIYMSPSPIYLFTFIICFF